MLTQPFYKNLTLIAVANWTRWKTSLSQSGQQTRQVQLNSLIFHRVSLWYLTCKYYSSDWTVAGLIIHFC